MNAEQFNQLVKKVDIGKKLPDAIYLHKDAFGHIPASLSKFIEIVAKALKISCANWNLVKLQRKHFGLSLLNYPEFFNESYPALHTSITIDLNKLIHKVTHYDQSNNPPILHRKETMLPSSHENYELFKLITEEGERAGLYENSRVIGFKKSWERIIEKKGYQLVDGRLLPLLSDVRLDAKQENKIDRHKTAIVRHDLSAPMKGLAKHGYLTGDFTIFDYGCGRGDDLRELEAHGLDAIGWDPNFCPENPLISSEVVNLGFVINVIEDQDERIEALQRAWELSEKLLVVSVMLGSESILRQFQPYKDGVITSRNTFQKYYAQSEIAEYIEQVLEDIPIAVAPGIFYIFKDKEFEQRFLQNRHKRHYQWKQLTSPEPTSKSKTKFLFTRHMELLEKFWLSCLAYGRCPSNEEFDDSNYIIEHIGSHKKAFNLVTSWFDIKELEQAEIMRKEDLLVYFALEHFGKRKPYTHQPDDLKRDIKAFFGTYKIAKAQSQELLFKISDANLIESECLVAHEMLPASKLYCEYGRPHALLFHKHFIDELSPILRVYINAALQLFGELDDIQIIKVHLHSGKVTLLGYENFHESPIPVLAERIKIKMAEQDVDIFDYINHDRRQVLLNKIDFIDDTFAEYKKQKAFNRKLDKVLNQFPDIKTLRNLELDQILQSQKLEVRRFQLKEVLG